MALITIKDLPLDVELDREAMAAVVGGSRASTGQPHAARFSTVRSSSSRIVDYPPGFARGDTPATANGPY